MSPAKAALVERLVRNRTVRGVAHKHAPRGMAEDAIQRAMLIVLEKLPDGLSESEAIRWTVTVTKREAWQLHRTGRREVPASSRDAVLAEQHTGSAESDSEGMIDRVENDTFADPSERAERRETMRRRWEAMDDLRPDERRALLLHEFGYSYREITRITGWTYTKVNRCMAEGRSALFSALARDGDTDRLPPRTIEGLRSRGELAVA